jgi:peptidoglycan-N-acetylglucosamine deacetylase
MRSIVALLLLVVSAGAYAADREADPKRIAITFDDVPRQPGGFFTPEERTKRLIEALRSARVAQAAFFVTTGNLEKPFGVGGEERIAAYTRAGHVIANHSHGHLWLSRTPADEYLADLDRAEAWLAGRPGKRPWFRFPFLDEAGRDSPKRDTVRQALSERGLRNGYVTIDNYDWYLDKLTTEARLANKPLNMVALQQLYVETLVSAANFYDRIARQSLRHSPPHVLLLHETDLNALFIDDLVQALRSDGWEIVSADEAYSDPIALDEPDTWFLGEGRVAALAFLQGRKPAELVHERTDEEVLKRLFDERVLLQSPPGATPAR